MNEKKKKKCLEKTNNKNQLTCCTLLAIKVLELIVAHTLVAEFVFMVQIWLWFGLVLVISNIGFR